MAAWNEAFSERIIWTKASTHKCTVPWRGPGIFQRQRVCNQGDPRRLLEPRSIMGTEYALAGLSEAVSWLRGDSLPRKHTHDSICGSAGTPTLLGQPLDTVSSCSGRGKLIPWLQLQRGRGGPARSPSSLSCLPKLLLPYPVPVSSTPSLPAVSPTSD